MARMIRKQLYIEPWQEEMLKRRSEDLGVTEAELMRRGIDLAVSRAAIRGRLNLEAWQQARAFMEKLMEKEVPQTGRDWTRDDLYEERLSRLLDRH